MKKNNVNIKTTVSSIRKGRKDAKDTKDTKNTKDTKKPQYIKLCDGGVRPYMGTAYKKAVKTNNQARSRSISRSSSGSVMSSDIENEVLFKEIRAR